MRFRHVLVIGWALLQTYACASGSAGPQIRTDAAFRSASLRDRTLLVLPVAVSSQFGDDRTGIVLDNESRTHACKAVCAYLSRAREHINVVCFNGIEASAQPQLEAVNLQYAQDQSITQDQFRELAESAEANFVLMFRPEGVAVGDETVRATNRRVVSSGSSLSVVSTPGPLQRQVARGYSLSAVLVDLRSGKLLRSGAHQGSIARRESLERDPRFVERPEAAEVLEKTMKELADAMLDD